MTTLDMTAILTDEENEELEEDIKSYHQHLIENDEEEKADVLGYLFSDVLDYESPPKRFDEGGWAWVAEKMGKKPGIISRRKHSVKSELKDWIG